MALAAFYSSSGDVDKSIRSLQTVIEKEPGNVAAKKQLAEMYANKKDYARAIQVVDELLKTNNKDTEAQVLKGRVLLTQGKTAEALAALQTAIKNDVDSPAAHYYLGVLYLQNNNRQNAEVEWTKAVSNAENFVQPYVSLARLKMDSGDPQAAARLARQAVAINPNSIDAQMIVALTSGNKDEFNRAIANVQQTLKRNPNEAVEVQIGGAYLGQRDLPSAEGIFESVLKTSPESMDAMVGLVRAYVMEGKSEKAIARLGPLVQSSKQTWPERLLAEVYLIQKNYPKAEEAYKRAISLEPDKSAHKATLAEFYAATGVLDKGVTIYEGIVKNEPANIPAKQRLAFFYFTQTASTKRYDCRTKS